MVAYAVMYILNYVIMAVFGVLTPLVVVYDEWLRGAMLMCSAKLLDQTRQSPLDAVNAVLSVVCSYLFAAR